MTGFDHPSRSRPAKPDERPNGRRAEWREPSARMRTPAPGA
jgi:hypothetical protein